MRPHLLLFALMITCLMGGVANATVKYQKVFYDEYLKKNPDKEFDKYVKRKARCNLCHQGVKDRTLHNLYGVKIADRTIHPKDEDNPEKILEVLREVAKMPSDPADEESPTYGELIADGKLPGGPLEEALKEPEDPTPYRGDKSSGEEEGESESAGH